MPERILFVVPYVPNLIRVRPYNLIRHLAERGVKVTVVTLWTDPHERQSLEQLEPFAERVIALRLPRWRSLWNVAGTIPSKKPLQARYCWSPELANELRSLVQPGGGGFDAIHVEHLRGVEYGLFLKRLLQGAIPIIWDSVDSISLLFRQAGNHSKSLLSRSITRFELGRTESYEGWLLGQFDRVAVTSSADRLALLALLPPGARQPDITVIPNGVDLDYFHPDDSTPRETNSLVISGKMSYHANVTMAVRLVAEIMPAVWAQRPDARVTIVGKDPSREVQALGADPRVCVTGTVEHLPPYLQRAAVAVAPIAYGAGIQNKVLEAMACGTPVVASAQAIRALEARPGDDLLAADSSAEFSQAILHLLEDAGERQRLGQAGRRYVETYHRWSTAAGQLEKLYSIR